MNCAVKGEETRAGAASFDRSETGQANRVWLSLLTNALFSSLSHRLIGAASRPPVISKVEIAVVLASFYHLEAAIASCF